MKIAIVGYGSQGRSAYEYWNHGGNEITICDQDESLKLPADVKKQLGADHLKNLGQFDLIVRSPIVHPNSIAKANSPETLDKVTTNTNEFFKSCPSKNIIGVTGTKGKGTTSTLIAKMLEANGKKMHLGGNIGTPPLDLLKAGIKPEDWVVLELANFQLIDIKTSPHIGVCLMVVDEHLDWHQDSQEYIEAKQQMFKWQTEQDAAIYYGLNAVSEHIAGASKGQKIPYMKTPGADVIEDKVTIDGQEICHVRELKLLGKHNWQNVCAAVTAVWQIDKNVDAMRSVLTTFTGLPNRLELVRALGGIDYYNDSFASGPGATLAAIDAVEKPKVMIVGGFERNLPLDELGEGIARCPSLRKVILIGESAQRVAQTLDKHGFKNYELVEAKTMPEIIEAARINAQKGDAIILSPGFASFDMFKNFEERGDKFRQAVNKL